MAQRGVLGLAVVGIALLAPMPSPAQTSGVFRPGDAVRISAFPDTASFVNSIYPIDGQGRILLPMLGKVTITGMTEAGLASLLDSTYLKYLRFPAVQVEPMVRISLLGGFYRPGLYYVNPDASFWSAVLLAGGTVREDGISKMVWERDSEVVSSDMAPYFGSGISLAKMGFRSGDRIRVTPKPPVEGWEIFTRDVVPVITLAVTTATAVGTLYISYKTYQLGYGKR